MGERPKWGSVLAEETKADSFTVFVTGYETRLRQALTAVLGWTAARKRRLKPWRTGGNTGTGSRRWTILPADWEMITAFFAGQGTILSPAECTVTEEVLGASATVYCRFETLGSLVQAIGAPSVSTSFVAVVTPDGIDRLDYSHGQPDFLNAGLPFERWIAENHPEAIEATALWGWATVEDARQTGVVTAQFAEEWATYLKENDCAFLDGC